MSAADERNGVLIITDLYNLTNNMMRQTGDAEFLAESVDKRQALMDEYDAYRKLHPGEDMTEIKKMVKEIIAMDTKIHTSLVYHRNTAKSKLSDAQKQQKVMGSYVNNSISSSGSYMNYTK